MIYLLWQLLPLPQPGQPEQPPLFFSRTRLRARKNMTAAKTINTITVAIGYRPFFEYGALPHHPAKGLSGRPLETFGQNNSTFFNSEYGNVPFLSIGEGNTPYTKFGGEITYRCT